jgi:hypothetical protein
MQSRSEGQRPLSAYDRPKLQNILQADGKIAL